MTTIDDQPERRQSTLWRPIVSALAVVAGAAYAFAYGIASIPPFIALFLMGALATVLFRLAEMLRRRFNNIVTSAMSAVTLMLSSLSGIALIVWVLSIIVGDPASPINRLLAATEVGDQIFLGFVLAIYLGLAFMALMQVITLWYIVRENAFGARHSGEN
jgi:hypothetical protein